MDIVESKGKTEVQERRQWSNEKSEQLDRSKRHSWSHRAEVGHKWSGDVVQQLQALWIWCFVSHPSDGSFEVEPVMEMNWGAQRFILGGSKASAKLTCANCEIWLLHCYPVLTSHNQIDCHTCHVIGPDSESELSLTRAHVTCLVVPFKSVHACEIPSRLCGVGVR
jgi:hypothetical protein